MSGALKKKISPGDICTQSGGLTHKPQLFLVVNVQEKTENALVVPVTTDHNSCNTIIQINHEKYRAMVAFPIELPLITLTVVPEMKIDNLQETLAKLQQNLHPEQKVIPGQTKIQEQRKAIKQTNSEQKKEKFSIVTLVPGTICTLSSKCKDKQLLSIRVRYFLVLENDGIKDVNVVPLYYSAKPQSSIIKINSIPFWVINDSAVLIPFNSLSVAKRMKLDEPQKVLKRIKRKQYGTQKHETVTGPSPIYKQENANSTPRLSIHPGDICKLATDTSPKPEIYYLVMNCRSEKEALVAPLKRTNTRKEAPEEIIINNEVFWIDVLTRQSIPISLLIVVSYNHIEVAKRIARRRSSIIEASRRSEKMRKKKVYDFNSVFQIDNKKRAVTQNRSAQKQAPADPTANKILYIYKGLIVCHRQEHPIIPAAATFFSRNGSKVKIDVEYCPKCDRLMMSYTSFCLYRDRFGVLIRNLRMISSGEFNGELTLAQESPLRLCGYTVSQAEGLTESERHYILAKMIHDNIMPKTEVVRYLEHFINMNGAKYGNELALSKWENDLKFVHNYRIDTQPEVYINAVEKY